MSSVLAVMAKNTLALNFGLSIGFPTIVIPALTDINADVKLTKSEISWFGSLFFIVIPFGCLFSGPLIHKFGRKPVMIALCVPFFFAWLLFYFANSALLLCLGIAVQGLINGLLEAPIVTYVAEVTEPKWRGMLSSSSVLASLFGVFVEFLLGIWFQWRHVAIINMIFPAISFLSLCFVPESPYWLVGKGRLQDAEASLCWLRGWCHSSEVQSELQTLIDHTKLEQKEGGTAFSVSSYMTKGFLKPFSLVIMSFCIGHFSGMSTLQTYAVGIFQQLGSPGYISAAIMSAAQMLGALVCMSALPWAGKRKWAIFSTAGCGVCLIILSTVWTTASSYWLVSLLILGVFLSNSCSKVFPWVLIGEVFSGKVRAVASGLASCIGYALGFLVNKTYFLFVDGLSLRGVFLMYGLVSLTGTVLYFLLLPETEGRSLIELQDHFSGRKVLPKGKTNPAFDPEEGGRTIQS